MLRMPVDEKTTVEEVDAYFTNLAESFKEQKREEVVCRKTEERIRISA